MRTDFSRSNAKYDDFLHEPIGDDARGITISMFSGLTRLRLDPWRESARFAAMPLEAASRAIAERIGELNVGGWDAVSNSAAAARLAKLLPKHGRMPAAAPRTPARATPRPQLTASQEALLRSSWRNVREIFRSRILPIAMGLLFLLSVGVMLAQVFKTPASDAMPSYGDVPGLNSRMD